MKNVYKKKAIVTDDEEGDLFLEINNYTFLVTPIRSQLTKSLKLKDKDIVEITVKVVKNKKWINYKNH